MRRTRHHGLNVRFGDAEDAELPATDFSASSSHAEKRAAMLAAELGAGPTLSQLAHIMAIRSKKESLFVIGIFSNPVMAATVIFTFALQMATIYVPALNPIFKTQALGMDELALCIALSSVVFFAVEIEKWLIRRDWIYRAS